MEYSKLYRSLVLGANTISLEKNVLIVDDDEDLRDVIAEDFSDQGYNVFVAESAQEAVKLYSKEKIDVVLTDIQMPHFNGLELVKMLKDLSPKLEREAHFLIMTGFSKYSREEILNCGASDLLEKPIDGKVMFDKITSLLNR